MRENEVLGICRLKELKKGIHMQQKAFSEERTGKEGERTWGIGMGKKGSNKREYAFRSTRRKDKRGKRCDHRGE